MTYALTRQPTSLLGDLFGSVFDDVTTRSRVGFVPPVDVIEEDGTLTVRAELPGVRKEDVKVHLDGDLLTLSGSKKHEEKSYRRVESRCGEFERTLTLPRSVDRDKISATFRDGVLSLTLPLREEAKRKTIDVAVN
jgi:HSP20 family protein